eukprot:3069583-Amphidinium_carterae.1
MISLNPNFCKLRVTARPHESEKVRARTKSCSTCSSKVAATRAAAVSSRSNSNIEQHVQPHAAATTTATC